MDGLFLLFTWILQRLNRSLKATYSHFCYEKLGDTVSCDLAMKSVRQTYSIMLRHLAVSMNDLDQTLADSSLPREPVSVCDSAMGTESAEVIRS